jgi:hypothetical protein
MGNTWKGGLRYSINRRKPKICYNSQNPEKPFRSEEQFEDTKKGN